MATVKDRDYRSLEEYMLDLIKGYSNAEYPLKTENNGEPVKLGAQYPNLPNATKENMIKELLQIIKNESDYLDHTGIREEDFLSGESWDGLFETINKLADLKPEAYQSLKSFLESKQSLLPNNNDFWNSSVNILIENYLRTFDYQAIKALETPDVEEEDGIVSETYGTIDSGKDINFRVSDIVNANAGESFLYSHKWVRPWFNIDSETYKKVRDNDLMKEPITTDRELQFTRSQIGKVDTDNLETLDDRYSRLLMPKYLRRVEIEDLNKNFWVIGQNLSAICAYVFNPDDSLLEIFKKVYNEIIGLWENIFYLWIETAARVKDIIYEDVEVIFAPVPNSYFLPYIKFDDFQGTYPTNNSRRIGEEQDNIPNVSFSILARFRFDYLIDQYRDKNLLIIPEIRSSNYFRNYYCQVFYPGMIFYDRNDQQWHCYSFAGVNGDAQNYLKLDDNFSGRGPIGMISTIDSNYRYILSNNVPTEDYSHVYTAMLRSQLENVNYTYTYNDGSPNKLEVHFNLSLTDVATELCGGAATYVASFNESNWVLENDIPLTPKVNEELNLDLPTITSQPSIGEHSINEGYYLGELLSWYQISNSTTPPGPEPPGPEPHPITEINYIQCTGTQYINTGYTQQSDSVTLEAEVEPIERGTTHVDGQNCLVYAYNAGIAMNWVDDGNRFQFRTYVENDVALAGSYHNINTGFIKIKTKIEYPWITIWEDEVQTASYKCFKYANENPTQYCLFAYDQVSPMIRFAYMKLKSCKIYDGETLVRDFIPVLNENEEPGLWDRVNGVFYGNDGTGEFLYG